jgi:hypothetical protein
MIPITHPLLIELFEEEEDNIFYINKYNLSLLSLGTFYRDIQLLFPNLDWDIISYIALSFSENKIGNSALIQYYRK